MSRDKDFRRKGADRDPRADGKGKRRGRSITERTGNRLGPEPEDAGAPEIPMKRRLRYAHIEADPGAQGKHDAESADAAANGALLDPADGSREAIPLPRENAESTLPHGTSAVRDRQRGVKYHQHFTESADAESSATPGRKPSKLAFTPDELPPEQAAPKLTERKHSAATNAKAMPKTASAVAFPPGAAKNTGPVIAGGASPSPAVKGRRPSGPAVIADEALSLIRRPARDAGDGDIGAETVDGIVGAAENAGRTAFRMKRAPKARKATALAGARKMSRPASQKSKHGSGKATKMAQRRTIRKGYASGRRTATRMASAMRRPAGGIRQAASRAVIAARGHPVLAATLAVLLILVFIIISAFSSCSNMGISGIGSVIASSYLAEDTAIDDAEIAYTEWEADIQAEAKSAGSTHPGYDEYRYSIGDVSHDPFELMAYLTAVYQDFTPSEADAALRDIFSRQYSLTYVPETEVRYRTETHTDPVTGAVTVETVSYEWHILNVRLAANSFTDIVYAQMDDGQRQIFDVLMVSKGNRQYVANVLDRNWLPRVSGYYGYRLDPHTGAKGYSNGIDITASSGTNIFAGHGGTVISAGDSGSYGLTVVVRGETPSGEDLVTRYSHCSQLLVAAGQKVAKGDVIAKVGNTGNVTGPHLHLEVIVEGRHLNPLYFADTGDDGSSYTPPGSPGGPDIPAYPGAPMTDERFAAMMEEAKKHLGKPYVFGASGPSSFDCSGFICYVLNHSGVKDVGRTTAQGLYNLCTPVSADDAKPGDLIFFKGTYSTSATVTHVGIYIGNGMMIHAGDPVKYADITTSYWKQHFYSFARV